MNKTKSRNTVIITICIASALMCIALTFWGNWKNNGVLTTDAFISVMATFIGVCATIIVGVQIVNHLELRKMQTSIKTIEEERKELEYQRKAFSVEMYNTRLGLGNAMSLMALTAKKNDNLAIEFESWVISIILDDWSSMKGSVLLKRYQRLVEIANSIIPNTDESFLEDTYNKLSILDVPKSIEHYDEIMSLHYKMLSDLKARQSNQTTSTENV
jgi:hypothetical protein